ncbi:unnamed protein product, partial [Protopolystoma xenopodis]
SICGSLEIEEASPQAIRRPKFAPRVVNTNDNFFEGSNVQGLPKRRDNPALLEMHEEITPVNTMNHRPGSTRRRVLPSKGEDIFEENKNDVKENFDKEERKHSIEITTDLEGERPMNHNEITWKGEKTLNERMERQENSEIKDRMPAIKDREVSENEFSLPENEQNELAQLCRGELDQDLGITTKHLVPDVKILASDEAPTKSPTSLKTSMNFPEQILTDAAEKKVNRCVQICRPNSPPEVSSSSSSINASSSDDEPSTTYKYQRRRSRAVLYHLSGRFDNKPKSKLPFKRVI